VVAVFQMSGDVGAALGPVVAGWIADGAGYTSSFLVCAAVCLVPMLALAAAPETLRAAPPAPLTAAASDVT
jgi:MFS family permease